MQDQKKLFFIILCTYNPNIQFFKMLIDSLRNQSYTHWQCVVLDDLSASEIFEKITDILQTDDRFTLERNKERLGVYHNFEKGLSFQPHYSDFICYCDQDDIWMPDKLAVMLEKFNDPTCMLCHSDLQLIDKDNVLIHSSCFKYEKRNIKDYTLKQLAVRNSITGCALAFRSVLTTYLLPFPKQEGKPAYYHDHWTALHAIMHGRIVTVIQPLISYRQHEQNVVGASLASNYSFLHFFQKVLMRKTKIFQRAVFLWDARKKLMDDFLNSIQSQVLSRRQQSEVDTLKKWGNINNWSISWLFFSLQQFLKRDSSCLVCFLSLLGKWIVMFKKSKKSL